MDKGWIKLHRILKDWEWYSDINATRLLVHILISVNYEDKNWRGIVIKAGSMVLSWKSLSRESKLSIQQCRTAMRKLKNSQEVTIESTNKYQVVSLVKWGKLQLTDDDANKQLNKELTSNQQADNRLITTTKEDNNIINKEDKKPTTEKTQKVFSEEVVKCLDNCLVFFPKELYPKNRNSWLDCIDKLNRIDKIEFDIIEHVVECARVDDFWKNNFMSLAKLRKLNSDKIKYITVFQQRFKNKGQKNYSGNR